MNTSDLSKITPYQDVNEVLHALSQGIVDVFAGNLVGIYLFGSLSYGDFHPESSDIDLVAILNKPASQNEMELIKQLHIQVGMKNDKWANRLECSYTPQEMLQNILPPKHPRPYFGEGIFYPEAHYGNEWIINLYLLYQHGLALIGPDFKALINPIPMVDVQIACIRDLFQEWEPKLTDPTWLNNSHYQSYIVLNLCRILYTVMCASTGSKKVSARWVKNEFGEWSNLIQTAEHWQYGTEMNLRRETIEFIKFIISKVKKTQVYTQLVH
jgi:predicted nucleotidyltransferase